MFTVINAATSAMDEALRRQQQYDDNYSPEPYQLSSGPIATAHPSWGTDDYSNMNWDLDHTAKSRHTPQEYSAPWEAEGWGGDDVAVTPPRKMDVEQAKFDERPLIPDRPGFIQGQKDYMYMPTEKEQRRERRAQALDLAQARGTRWQDTPLPGGRPAPEPTYGRWQDAELPQEREVVIQPVPDRDEVVVQPVPDRDEVVVQPVPIPDDDIVWTGGSRDFDERTGTYRPGHRGSERPTGPREDNWQLNRSGNYVNLPPGAKPKRARAFDVRSTGRRPTAGRGMSTSATRDLGDDGRISLLTGERSPSMQSVFRRR